MNVNDLNDNLTTKENLLRAATKIFAAKGFNGATVKEIADEAGVNVSLVSYHYNGKENLFRACVQAYGEKRLGATETFLKTPQSAEDFRVRLTLYLEDYFHTVVTEQDTVVLMLRECMGTNPLIEDIFQTVFMRGMQNMVTFFSEARERGILRAEIDPHYLVIILKSAIMHVIQMDEAHQRQFKTGLKDPIHREKIISTLLQLVLGGAQL